jgi:hypothetical protein
MPEELTFEFKMLGAREVLTAGAQHLERQIIALEGAVRENPGLAFDLARSLVETSCKTILKDRDHDTLDDADLPRLLKETLKKMRLAPDDCDDNTNVNDKLRKMTGGLLTVIDGICWLRTNQGFASHGRDAYATQLESVQAQLAARSADAIVNFLFKVHKGDSFNGCSARIAYSDNSQFNSYIDENNEIVRIFGLEFSPSEVLYHTDFQAYRDNLIEHNANKTEDEYSGNGEPSL